MRIVINTLTFKPEQMARVVETYLNEHVLHEDVCRVEEVNWLPTMEVFVAKLGDV